ncbi:hypothetical protein ACQR1Y_12040 [Bradyrhizobium sp. HKCCYLRH3099]|uniref:hypothetical protein n=1 Tax=unclassified Bradyrhizobium TaxID=2631580 RepID=UPI003EBDA650
MSADTQIDLDAEMDGRVKPGHDEAGEVAGCANPDDVLGRGDPASEITDPVIRALCAAHRARKVYPAGHTFAMTNPVINGLMVTMGTCSCGDVFSFPFAGGYQRMDAAVEAHWQRFDHLPGKTDGRGQPIESNAEAPAPNGGAVDGADGGHAVQEHGFAHPADEADSIRRSLLAEPDDVTLDWPSYDQFLEDKIVTAPLRGIEVARAEMHDYLKPHCKDLVVWGLRLGCAAIFASFGLHKTAMQLEWCRQLTRHTGQPSLIVVPLGVRHGFIKEALNLGMDIRFVRTTADVDDLYCEGIRHFLTNYESIREGKLDPNIFEAVSLDEASCLRSYGSKTFQEFLPLFAKVPFKLVATATPSPNRYKELIHYAGFLGVMDTGLALTRWFQRNSEKAGDLTLYPHKESEFWMWVHSWAAFLQKPSELGYSDEGYELPPLDLRWHEVPADHSRAEPERDGQGVLLRDVARSLSEAAKARRDSLGARIARMMQIIAEDPEAHFLIWHDLEAEREAIEQALPGVVTITGSGMSIDEREIRLADFEEGRTKYFGTKPTLSGSGSNFQYHCHRMIFVALPGFGFKFNDFIQALHRLYRFGQQRQVIVDIVYAEDERAGRAVLEEKWALDLAMRARMSEIIRAHGLNTLPLRDALARSIGVERVEIRGNGWVAVNNDAVVECANWPENSVDQIITSVPFGNQYEYSASYRDFGHTDDSAHFWAQMDHLTPSLLRMLKPGRLACIHVKDRVLFGSVTGAGVPTVSPFHAEAIMHYRAHGFDYCGMITVITDVVRENNQTYRLGWSENAKDSTKMGVGMPEYVLLLRKPQTDRSRSYADVPVTKLNKVWEQGVCNDETGYSRARWQIDAHAFWRSSGNRHLTPEEFAGCEAADHARLFAKISAERVYDYEAHVRIGETLERQGTLPATFMSIAPGSHHPDVWHDVNRMRTLNMMQQRKGAEMHLCLARDSRVLTRERGYVSIQDVTIGEHCLTHKGRWRPVLAVANTGVQPVVTVRAQGVAGLTLTPDHKLWVRKSDWVRQRDGAERVQPDWIEAQACLGGYVNQKLPDAEQPENPDLLHWWIVGRWLADGHWEDRGAAIISCGAHELSSLVEALAGRAGGRYWTGTSWQVRVLDPDGSLKVTLRQCGSGAAGKHLPPDAFTLPAAQAGELVEGYLSGDGHRLDGRKRWLVTAVSRDLLLGLSLLAQRAYGAIASVYEGRPERNAEIQGRAVHCRQEWVLCFDLPEVRRKTPFVLDDGAWKRVRSIEDAGEAETWCLRVEEDESFTAEGCIVKNCPLQFDIVDRLIERYSNPGELVFDPFGGLMTVPYRALLKRRRGAATELSAAYYMDGVHYLRMAEEEMATPDLFALMGGAAVAMPGEVG